MDFGPNASSTMLSMLNFDQFEDDVSEESHDLKVEPGFQCGDSNSLPLPNLIPSDSVLDDTNTDKITLADVPKSTATAADTNESMEKRKGGWPKGKRRRKLLKDVNAPKQPLTGYIRFIALERERIRDQNPTMTFGEITKNLGSKWSSLPAEEKQKYLDEAEKDKERYNRELEAYHKTDAYKTFVQQLNKAEETVENTDAEMELTQDIDETQVSNAFDIPIFTEEFLDHNKQRESELRQLRRQTTELEEQNAILSKHIDNMKSAIVKLEVEAVQTINTNVALQQHLAKLRQMLVTNFTSLPGMNETPTIDSIDMYMARLHSMILDAPQENDALVTAVRDIVARLNFDGEKL